MSGTSPEKLIEDQKTKKATWFPRIIHQTWKTEEVPKHWKVAQESWVREHPPEKGWIYILWTDEMNENFIKTYYPWFLPFFQGYVHGIQRADAIRYFLLHRYGGFYVDLDIYCKKPLDDYIEAVEARPLIKRPDVLLYHTKHALKKDAASNMMMASVKGAPFWTLVHNLLQDSYEKLKWTQSKHLHVMFSTGPSMIDSAMRQYRKINKDEDPNAALYDIQLFDPQKFTPCGSCDAKPCTNTDSYVEMIEGMSWIKWDTRVINYCFCKPWHVASIVLGVFLFFLILGLSVHYGRKRAKASRTR